MVSGLQNIRLKWHILGVFEIAEAENEDRFSRK